MKTRDKLLKVNIKLMQFLNLWPKSNKKESTISRMFKDFTGCIHVILGSLTATIDFFIQISGQYDDLMDITENLTAMVALYGAIYMGVCFVRNRKKLMILIDNFEVFEEFGTTEIMLKTEIKTAFITKVIIIYGIVGNLIYLAAPYINLNACREKRSHYKYSKDMPCELVTRFRIPFRYEDNWWTIQAAVIWQELICLNTTMITLSITMFAVSMLMQIIAQLQELRQYIRRNMPVRDCIRFHITIISYASDMSNAFSSIMLMYITLTSFEISVLGFEVLMVNSISTSIRYALHLFGWITLLFLICSYGQQLIDESKAIGFEAYSCSWYTKSVQEQQDLNLMIMRSQKPLILTAASLGIVSLEAFLNVLSTAYSYFTLLLNMKDN